MKKNELVCIGVEGQVNGPLKLVYGEQVDIGRVDGERDEWDSRGSMDGGVHIRNHWVWG